MIVGPARRLERPGEQRRDRTVTEDVTHTLELAQEVSLRDHQTLLH